jgi:hypothetical protein
MVLPESAWTISYEISGGSAKMQDVVQNSQQIPEIA